MNLQNERNEKVINFCNPETSLKEAVQIANFLSIKRGRKNTASSFIEDDLYKKAKVWNKVENCLSFNTLDKVALDIIENKLGTKVVLQVYRFYLEQRRSDNLQEADLITQNKLVGKMQSVNCDKAFIDHLLKLT
ncbi:MAG: hypothetical protein FD167_3691 [bacterium]|nr:MAG: hypothetical protein FD167_3691 [bacterium]